jgi:hypothetical protein
LTMETIASLSRAEFEELRDGYLEDGHGADAPSLIDTLELIRSDIADMLEKTPLNGSIFAVRGDLATLLDIATFALTMDRAAKESTP